MNSNLKTETETETETETVVITVYYSLPFKSVLFATPSTTYKKDALEKQQWIEYTLGFTAHYEYYYFPSISSLVRRNRNKEKS